jgi:UV DNA damage endonuclease
VHVKVDSALEQNTGTDALIEQPPAAHLSAPADDNTNVGAIVEKEAAEGPNGEGDLEDEEEVREALSRPPPVNSDILPLPWKGRLGYVRAVVAFIKNMANQMLWI